MTQIALAQLPLEARVEAAVGLISSGADPLAALAAAIWPTGIASVQNQELVERYCQRGHPQTPENVYMRSDGWGRCRVCQREANATRVRTKAKREKRKVPCVYCGAPATAPGDKGTGGLDTPRCRACFMAQMRAR